jgi:hypothetical protein
MFLNFVGDLQIDLIYGGGSGHPFAGLGFWSAFLTASVQSLFSFRRSAFGPGRLFFDCFLTV